MLGSLNRNSDSFCPDPHSVDVKSHMRIPIFVFCFFHVVLYAGCEIANLECPLYAIYFLCFSWLEMKLLYLECPFVCYLFHMLSFAECKIANL